MFAAVAVVQPIAVTIDIALYLYNSTSHHEHSYITYALEYCSLIFSFCLIMTGPVCTAIAKYVLQYTLLPMLICKRLV
jgi:hypothetical protein